MATEETNESAAEANQEVDQRRMATVAAIDINRCRKELRQILENVKNNFITESQLGEVGTAIYHLSLAIDGRPKPFDEELDFRVTELMLRDEYKLRNTLGGSLYKDYFDWVDAISNAILRETGYLVFFVDIHESLLRIKKKAEQLEA